MIYYATIDNKIGSSNVLPEGAIEIPTKDEYKVFLKDKQKNKLVTIEGKRIVIYESPVYSIDGKELKERDPNKPLILQAPPETLHKPLWKNGEWVENESDQERLDRLTEEKEQARQKLKRDRDEALNNLVHTFADGKQMQVRPQDKGNIETAISNNVEQKWIMADNTTRLVTVNELQVALDDGIQQGQSIWNKYVDDLEQLMGSN